ncbi:MAG: transcription termination/antitermination protein NusG [Verrucomicrobiae bacterium]|nr:transcription termination/antitermination protein NusG [Verrucomicrobiae bacterium]
MSEANTQNTDGKVIEGSLQWFSIHVLSGQENKVRDSLMRRIKTEEMGDYIKDIVIPTERVSEVKGGKKKEVVRKLFPGYIFLHMHLYDDKRQLMGPSWYFVRETTGVIGFVGGDRPAPLQQAEIDDLLATILQKDDKVKPKVDFAVGEKVRINDGPFMSLEAGVDEVDSEKGKLKVSVSIFGRNTPVELEYWQVERITD